MKVDISFKNLNKSELIDNILDKNLTKIKNRIKNFNEDSVRLSIHLEKNQNHNEYFCNTCLYIPKRVLKASTTDFDLIKSIDKNFSILVRHLDKLKSKVSLSCGIRE